MNFDLEPLMPQITDFGMKVVGVIVVLIIARIIAGWAAKLLARRMEKTGVDPTLSRFFATILRATIFILAILSCLSVFGINTTSFAALLAAIGLAIGMALQGTLGNFASGVLLVVLRPFKVGDLIKVAGETGVVNAVDLFTTTMDTPDNRRIIVPNGEVTSGVIENMSFHPNRRVDVNVGTDYSADLGTVRRILETAAASVPGQLEAHPPQVFLSNLGDSSINWQVRTWCHPDDYWDVWQATTLATKQALDAANIGIPFPQMDVHMDQ